jgi:hypothetical protein
MKTKYSRTRLLLTLVVALTAAAPLMQAEETNHWHYDLSLNLFLAGLSGDVTTRGIPAEVDASFADIKDKLEFAVAGRFTVGYDRWALSTEVSYMALGVNTRPVDLDMDQWLVEPTLSYAFCKGFTGFAGVRYNNINGDLRLNGPRVRTSSGTQDWWDPIVGAQVSLPLGTEKLSLNGRFDVGGFGVGSDFTWQAFPYLNWRFAQWGSAQLGYRWLGTDYENGSGRNKFVYDVVVQGPQLGVTVHF